MTTLTSATIDLFLVSLSENGCSPNTVRAYRADLLGFLGWVGASTQGPPPAHGPWLDSLLKQYLNQHRDKMAPRTMARKMSAFRAMAKWQGDLILKDYKAPKAAPALPHPIPEGIPGVLDMLNATENPEYRAFVALCGLGGLRAAEALAQTPSCIDPMGDQLISVFGKGMKYRNVPLTKTAWHYIEPAWTASCAKDQTGDSRLMNMCDRTARDVVSRLGRAAALSRHVVSHDLRATFATAAYDKTGDLRAVQELLGHASSDTTEIYTGISMAKMRAAAEVA